jgi:nucleoside-diphosphate-sugar epimerase
MNKKTILVAGATGNLGSRIVKYLLQNGANVKVICRIAGDNTETLAKSGAEVIIIEKYNLTDLTKACLGVDCVISALSGLSDVLIDNQKILLEAAIAAKVPRFIPSDFSIDFTKLELGQNRNLDLRKTFHNQIENAPIAVTSIFNGAFADMVTAEMPLILFKIKKILCWGNADQKMDFTTIENTAEYTALVALDDHSPRYLYIAGSQISARDTSNIASKIFGAPYGIFRPGGLGLFKFIIKIARKFDKTEQELYPAWQGMQYMHNMMEGKVKFEKVDNNRYPELKFTTIEDILMAYLQNQKSM